jgi:hypothetical protein
MIMEFGLCLASIAALFALAWVGSSFGSKPRQEPHDEEEIAEIFSRLDAKQLDDLLKYMEYLQSKRE